MIILVLGGIVLFGLWLWIIWWFSRWFRAQKGGFRRLLKIPFQSNLLQNLRTLAIWTQMWELGVVVLGAWIPARAFLVLDATRVPAGREFLSTAHYYHFWEWISSCGWCAFWAPFGGGFPILADPMPGLLYPLVAIPVIFFGTINGVKVAIFLSVLSAGLAIWWQGRLWNIRPLFRLWGSWMIMASGLFSARLELGDLHTVFGLAALAWVFPAWWYAWHKKKKDTFAAVPFAWALGLSILAARGYHLFGFLFSWGVLVILMFWLEPAHRTALIDVVKRGLLSAFALSAPVLLPLLFLLPYITKEVDPFFKTTQSLYDILINFIVRDPDFYYSEVLNKLPYPHLNNFFVGWIPFLLAIYAVVLYIIEPHSRRYPVGWAATWIVLILWVASGQVLRWVIIVLPWPRLQDLFAGVRHIEQIAALAIVPLIGLSMIGAEDIGRRLKNGHVYLQIGAHRYWPLMALFVFGLYFPIYDGWKMGARWMRVETIPSVAKGIAFLQSAGYQWVDGPYGEHFWVEPLVAHRLKVIHTGILRWKWRDWSLPSPRRLLVRGLPKEIDAAQIQEIEEGLYGLVFDENEYAFVEFLHDTTIKRVPCSAQGWGGKIEIHCPVIQHPARLWIMEKAWPGWWAFYNGHWIRLRSDTDYLSLSLQPSSTEETIYLLFIPETSLFGFWIAFLWLVWQIMSWRRSSVANRQPSSPPPQRAAASAAAPPARPGR